MADNVVLNPGVGGATIATDDVGGIQHELVKLEFGADGIATMVDAANPLPVSIIGGIIVGSEVEIKNDAGSPVPISAAALPLPTGAATAANQQTNALTDGQLRATAVPVTVSNPTANPETGLAKETTLGTLNTNTAKEFGIWDYVANSLTGAGNVTGVGRCVGIRVFANGVDSSFNIGGGDTIPVRNGAGVDIDPKGNLVNAVVNWVSGSIDVIIESVS